MSSFEFIIVLVSVIFGLAVAHLLSGVARAIHNRHQSPISWLHLTWTGAVFALLALEWWTLFAMSDQPRWSYWVFLAVLSYAVLLYMLAALLYPPDPEGAPDLLRTFENNRTWFLGTLTLTLIASMGFTALQGNFWNPWYLPLASLHLAALSGVGVLVANERYQRFLAIYYLSFLLGWGLIVRGLLAA